MAAKGDPPIRVEYQYSGWCTDTLLIPDRSGNKVCQQWTDPPKETLLCFDLRLLFSAFLSGLSLFE
jgi:hypothetical protein